MIPAKVYSNELIGDHTLVTCALKDAVAALHTVTIKMDKDFEAEMGADVGIAIEPSDLYVFEQSSGDRIRF